MNHYGQLKVIIALNTKKSMAKYDKKMSILLSRVEEPLEKYGSIWPEKEI